LARTPNRAEWRGHAPKTQSDTGLAAVIRETTRLWRRHDLGYDQTKYVVEHVRRELDLAPHAGRRRTVDRLDRFEVERLIQAAYRTHSRQGLMIKSLFLTGARVSEFVQVRVEDLHLDSDPPQQPAQRRTIGPIEPQHDVGSVARGCGRIACPASGRGNGACPQLLARFLEHGEGLRRRPGWEPLLILSIVSGAACLLTMASWVRRYGSGDVVVWVLFALTLASFFGIIAGLDHINQILGAGNHG